MKWEKKGILYKPDGSFYWNKKYGLVPTPFITSENKLRVYFTSTCEKTIGRIAYIEFPGEVSSDYVLSANPVLVEGRPGDFDDSGCIPSCVIRKQDKTLLYYAGYQRSVGVSYLLLSGYVISEDDGKSFERWTHVPLFERTNDEPTLRSAPCILSYQNEYLAWYVSAISWIKLDTGIFKDRTMPTYVIRHARSHDGIEWTVSKEAVFGFQSDDEFGFGRPWVIYDTDRFKMWYSIRRKNISYRIGYAESFDALHWERKDAEVGIDVSETGWDSEMICNPSVIKLANKTLLFYNGNNNGETGFGWAELVE